MYPTFHISCQNQNCKNETVVYLRDLPRVDKYYTFVCPNCKSKTLFGGTFALVNEFIPENAIEAEIAD